MSRFGAGLLATCLLAGCAPPAMVAVEVDEPFETGALRVGGAIVGLMRNVDGAYWAKWTGSDAKGEIVLRYADGSILRCRVNLLVPGFEPRRIVVRHRTCTEAVAP